MCYKEKYFLDLLLITFGVFYIILKVQKCEENVIVFMNFRDKWRYRCMLNVFLGIKGLCAVLWMLRWFIRFDFHSDTTQLKNLLKLMADIWPYQT